MIMKKVKKVMEVCLEGNVLVSKQTLWLAGAVLLLAGIVYGLKTAPLTHGIHIGCNNSSQNDCTFAETGSSGKNGEEKG